MVDLVLELVDEWQRVSQFLHLTSSAAKSASEDFENTLDRLAEAVGVPMPAPGPYEPFRPTPGQGVFI
jgi:hypothetical protein